MTSRVKWPKRPLLLVFVLCSIASLVVLVSGRALPMTDLPHHVAQLALGQRMGTGAFADQLEHRLFTPYLLAYGVGRLLAVLLPATEAIRCLVAVSVIGLPWALWQLLRRAGGDPWWALLGFPLAFNVVFYFGFLSYLLTLPLGVLFLATVHRHARTPSRRLSLGLAVFGALLFFGHALVWGACVLCALAIVLGGDERTWKERVFAALPVVAAAPIAIGWTLATRAAEPLAARETQWALGVDRFPKIADHLLGGDPLAAIALFALLVAVGVGARRLSKDPRRYGPALIGAFLYLATPWAAMGAFHLYPRFAVLAAILFLPACEGLAEPSRRRTASRVAIVILVLVWAGVLVSRVRDFDREAQGYFEVAKSVEPGHEVYMLIDDPKLDPFAGDPFLHLPLLLQVDADVIVEVSLARHYPSPVRFKDGVRPTLDRDNPLRELKQGRYRYVVVRYTAPDPLPKVAPNTFGPEALWKRIAESGSWSVWRR